jgi:hypothetical protein
MVLKNSILVLINGKLDKKKSFMNWLLYVCFISIIIDVHQGQLPVKLFSKDIANMIAFKNRVYY